VAGVDQAPRRPACPRDEDRLVGVAAPRIRVHCLPVVGPQVQVELQRRAVLAVVVAVRELRPHQVLGPGHGGERVAVPLAGREAPQRLGTVPPHGLEVGGYPVVLAGVDVGAVRDVEDAGDLVRVPAVVGVMAAVDAQEICIHHVRFIIIDSQVM